MGSSLSSVPLHNLSTLSVGRYLFSLIHHLFFFFTFQLLLSKTKMFSFSLYQSACLYASVTAFSATWIALALPIQHGKAGPFNYHRAIRQGRRIPWRRIPGMKI